MTVWDHLSLFLAVDQVVVVLHGDELVPAVLLGNVLKCLEFPSGHGAGTNVPGGSKLVDVSHAFCSGTTYLTFPLSMTSFKAFMISSLGVSLSSLQMWRCEVSVCITCISYSHNSPEQTSGR